MSYYLVNTNERYNKGGTSEIILKHEVSIFGNKKQKIKKFKNGDKIFLYEKRKGIVGYGKVKDIKIIKKEWNDDESYSLDLEKFIDFTNNPIKFSAKGGKFLGTVAPLSEFELEKIRKNCF